MKSGVQVIGIAALVLAGCVAAPSSGEAGRAAVVVIHGDGTRQSACIDLDSGELTGTELLSRVGWDYQIDAGNAMGVLVCRIDGEGCAFPTEDCMCRCRPSEPCQYWAYFNRDPGGPWTYGAFGASQRRVVDGSMDAWVWLTSASADEAAAPVLESLTLEDICGNP
jgi:hypothetical protein